MRGTVNGEPVFVDSALGQELSILKGFMKAESGQQAVYAAMDKIKEQQGYIEVLESSNKMMASDYIKLEDKNKRLLIQIAGMKDLHIERVDWILEELKVPKSDRASLYAESIAASLSKENV